jgi:hypothetical protein
MIMNRAIIPLIMLVVGLGLGLLSAQYMMEKASVASPVANSGWKEIRVGTGDLNATYLAGHFLRRGQLPPPKGSRFYVRTNDDEGNSLRGDCLVVLDGAFPVSRWWFVSASSGAGRTSFDASQAVREVAGETVVSLSASPAPGNWLAPPSGGSYELQLVLFGMTDDASGSTPSLPRVKRQGC